MKQIFYLLRSNRVVYAHEDDAAVCRPAAGLEFSNLWSFPGNFFWDKILTKRGIGKGHISVEQNMGASFVTLFYISFVFSSCSA